MTSVYSTMILLRWLGMISKLQNEAVANKMFSRWDSVTDNIWRYIYAFCYAPIPVYSQYHLVSSYSAATKSLHKEIYSRQNEQRNTKFWPSLMYKCTN